MKTTRDYDYRRIVSDLLIGKANYIQTIAVSVNGVLEKECYFAGTSLEDYYLAEKEIRTIYAPEEIEIVPHFYAFDCMADYICDDEPTCEDDKSECVSAMLRTLMKEGFSPEACADICLRAITIIMLQIYESCVFDDVKKKLIQQTVEAYRVCSVSKQFATNFIKNFDENNDGLRL